MTRFAAGPFSWLVGLTVAALIVAGLTFGGWEADSTARQTSLKQPPGLGRGVDWYVTVNGVPWGDGSQERPWDLDSALVNPKVRSGDVIWVHGGRYLSPYSTGDGSSEGRRFYFRSTLAGTAQAPIVVRAVQGQRVTLVGNSPRHLESGLERQVSEPAVVTVAGAYTWFWGFELTLDRSDRLEWSTNPDGCRGGVGRLGSGVAIEADGVQLINMVIHDTGDGVPLLKEATNSQLYGSLVYYNGRVCGWTDEPVGHGVYGQSHLDRAHEQGRAVLDNFVFDNMEYQLHFFSSGGGGLSGLTIEGNTIFNTGFLAQRAGRPLSDLAASPNVLTGSGSVPVDQTRVRSNVTFYPLTLPSGVPFRGGLNIQIGWGTGPGCKSSQWTNNYSVGGTALRTELSCALGESEIYDNVLIGATDEVKTHPGNTAINYNKEPLPSRNVVRIRPNQYEKGRANITVLNWENLAAVRVDLRLAGLKDGQEFEVRDAQDFFGPPVLTTVFRRDASVVQLRMDDLHKVQPVGMSVVDDVPHTAPLLGTFVVMPK